MAAGARIGRRRASKGGAVKIIVLDAETLGSYRVVGANLEAS